MRVVIVGEQQDSLGSQCGCAGGGGVKCRF